jgi:hypothetical protein
MNLSLLCNNLIYKIIFYLPIKNTLQLISINKKYNNDIDNTKLWKLLDPIYFPLNTSEFFIKKLFLSKYNRINRNILQIDNLYVLKAIANNSWANKLFTYNYITINNIPDTYIRDNIYEIMSDMQRVNNLRLLKSTKTCYDFSYCINIIINELLDRTIEYKQLIKVHLQYYIKNKYNI